MKQHRLVVASAVMLSSAALAQVVDYEWSTMTNVMFAVCYASAGLALWREMLRMLAGE